jgi:hypothetical protein
VQQSLSLEKLAPALVKVHKELKSVVKSSTNPHFNSKFASLDSIMEMARPILATHGFAVLQGSPKPISDAEGRITAVSLETTLLHESGEWISNYVILPVGTVPVKDKAGLVVGSEPTAQTAGASITYGRRYGLSALLAITSEEDDDGQRASEQGPRSGRRARPSGDKTERAVARVSNAPQQAAKPAQEPKKKAADRVVKIGDPPEERRLGDLADEELTLLVQQAKNRDAKRYEELINAAEEILEERRTAREVPKEAVKPKIQQPEDLPF